MRKLGLLCVVALLAVSGAALADSPQIYNSMPSPYPGNVPSQSYQATQTAEFGDEIAFAGGGGQKLGTVTAAMSDWAVRSDYMNLVDGNWVPKNPLTNVTLTAAGFYYPLTFNIYNIDNSGSVPKVGSLIATLTSDEFIPWRPESVTNIENGDTTGYYAADGNYYHGSLSNVTFDFRSLNVTLPAQVIYGLAMNTETWGAVPTGQEGPYCSLNFGLASAPPSVGNQVNPGTVFWNTETAGWYTDDGASGVGTFRQDTNWAPYVPAVQFNAVPEPVTMFGVLLGIGALGRYWSRKRANAVN